MTRVYLSATCAQYRSSNPLKSELRSPKADRSPNSEFRRRKPGRTRSSALGFRISFGFRASEFGLQVQARAGNGCVSTLAQLRTARLLPCSGVVRPANAVGSSENGLRPKSYCGPANGPANESRDMNDSAIKPEAQGAAALLHLPSAAPLASPGRTVRPGTISSPTYDPTINPQMTARELQPAPSLKFEKGTAMNPNPYPNGRWTSPAAKAPAAADTRPSRAIPAARRSCLDISPRKWLRAPVAPDMLASTLHELFWGAPDSGMVSEAQARIERVIQRAMEQTDFFRRQEAANVSPAS